jgi:hypothetical protein
MTPFLPMRIVPAVSRKRPEKLANLAIRDRTRPSADS